MSRSLAALEQPRPLFWRRGRGDAANPCRECAAASPSQAWRRPYVARSWRSSGIAAPEVSEDLLALDEALERLAEHDSQAAELVKLRYFAGLTIPQAAEILGVSPRKADFMWSFARAWLRREIEER